MAWNEIEVPKEIRKFMLNKSAKTLLGDKRVSSKQYRFSKLHISEYDDKYLVRRDKVKPRDDPTGRLIYDATEVLVGIACAVYGSTLCRIKSIFYNYSKKNSSVNSLVTSLVLGYTGYIITKTIKNFER